MLRRTKTTQLPVRIPKILNWVVHGQGAQILPPRGWEELPHGLGLSNVGVFENTGAFVASFQPGLEPVLDVEQAEAGLLPLGPKEGERRGSGPSINRHPKRRCRCAVTMMVSPAGFEFGHPSVSC